MSEKNSISWNILKLAEKEENVANKNTFKI